MDNNQNPNNIDFKWSVLKDSIKKSDYIKYNGDYKCSKNVNFHTNSAYWNAPHWYFKKAQKPKPLITLRTNEEIQQYVDSGGGFYNLHEKPYYSITKNGQCFISYENFTKSHYLPDKMEHENITHIVNSTDLSNFLFRHGVKPSAEECLKFYKMMISSDMASVKLADDIIFGLHPDFTWLKILNYYKNTNTHLPDTSYSYSHIFKVPTIINVFKYFKQEGLYNFGLTLEAFLKEKWDAEFKVTEKPFKIEM